VQKFSESLWQSFCAFPPLSPKEIVKLFMAPWSLLKLQRRRKTTGDLLRADLRKLCERWSTYYIIELCLLNMEKVGGLPAVVGVKATKVYLINCTAKKISIKSSRHVTF
jgi:hypothetical protein